MSESTISERTREKAAADTVGPAGLGVPPRARVRGALLIVLIVAAAAIAVSMLAIDIPRLAIGGLSIALLLLLLLIGVPIGIAMIGSASIGLISISGAGAASSSIRAVVYDSVASWSLSVVPLFLLMGVAMWKSGITTSAYSAARQWLGRLPGGLAFATNFAGAGLATTSGSTMGITLALGRMAIPEMLRAGYKPTIAAGSVAMAGTLGQIIPPSILLIVYAGVAQVPVGPQMLAAVIPGTLLALSFGATIAVWAIVRPSVAPRSAELTTWGSRFRSLRLVVPIVIVAAIVLGGMFSGFFTATEAAAYGALAALVIGWLSLGKGKKGVRQTGAFVRDSIVETAAALGGLFLIIIGALMLTRVIALSGLAQQISNGLTQLDLNRVELLLILIVVYVVLGMFLESLPMILLTVPFLQAPLEAVGVDMMWFGVFLIIMCEIGMVFPPIGMLAFVVHRLAQSKDVNLGHTVKLTDVYRGIMPFVAVTVVLTIIFILWPDIVLWLPGLSVSSS